MSRNDTEQPLSEEIRSAIEVLEVGDGVCEIGTDTLKKWGAEVEALEAHIKSFTSLED